MQISTRLFSTYLVHVCIGSIDASCTHFFFSKTSWPLQILAANPPGNLTAEFTQDLDKVALPAMSVVQSSDRDPEVSGGFFTRLVPPVVRKGGKGSNGTHLNHNRRFRLEGFITIPEGFAFSLAVRLIQKETLKPVAVALCMCFDPHCSCQ